MACSPPQLALGTLPLWFPEFQQKACLLQESRPPSHQSSQRADALRQLQELWLSDEAEQQLLPDSSQGRKSPAPQQAHASQRNGASSLSSPAQQFDMNGHSSSPSPEQQGRGRNGDLKQHLAAHRKQENGLSAVGSAQERSRQHASDAFGAILSSQGHDSAGSWQDGLRSGDRLGSAERSDMQRRDTPLNAEPVARRLHPSMTDLAQEVHRKQGQKEGRASGRMLGALRASDSEHGEQPEGHPAGDAQQLQPGLQPAQVAEDALPGGTSDGRSVHWPSKNAVLPVHATAQQVHGDAEHAAPRDLPVSIGAARVSDDGATSTSPCHMPAVTQSRSTAVQPPALSQSSVGSSSAGQAERGVPGQATEPAWVSGFRGDMGLAMSTPFLQHSARFARAQHETSSPSLPPAKLGSESSLDSAGVTSTHEYDKHSSCIIPEL